MSRLAVVTGASSGIGRGVAIALGAAGFELALVARRRGAIEETAAAALAAGAPAAAPFPADLADAGACSELADQICREFESGPAVFVHCAGIADNGPVESLGVEAWERSMAINAGSAFILAGRFAPLMAAAGWGRIVSIGSLYSRFGVSHTAAYTASKHALLGLTRVLAAEFAQQGVTANVVVPGFVDTEMIRTQVKEASEARGLSEEEVEKRFLSIQPLGRMVKVDEVAAMVAFLCSDPAAPIIGQAIHVDGGAYQA